MRRALQGRVLEHQRKMLEHQLGYIDSLTSLISDLDEDIKKTNSINWAVQALDAIPGIGRQSAERILTETGVEMEHFQNESRFSSWAGLVQECKESYFYSRYQRIAARRGGKRALIAIAHTMLIAIYHILKEKVPYRDLGAGYYSLSIKRS